MALQSGMIERGIRAFSQLLVVAVDAKRASWAGNERYLPAFGGRYPVLTSRLVLPGAAHANLGTASLLIEGQLL